MKPTPLNPIRRALQDSVTSIMGRNGQPEKGPESARTLRFENLEDRRVLSGNGIGAGIELDQADSGFVTTTEVNQFGFQSDAITHLTVLVNGEVRELTPQNNTLDLNWGDTVEVADIHFTSDSNDGVFAAEGYINKIGDLTSASLIDYNDGRFSGGERDFVANGGDGTVGGLNNSWTVDTGWDRLTINLMHYTESGTEVAGRFFVNMQVGTPDFAFDTDKLDTILEQEITVGDEVTIPAGWLNQQAGIFHNYAEVDIYHACDPNQILWAGASIGNAGDLIEGEFVNTREGDGFTERWIPTESGEYILRYYVDPENSAKESNEDNNEYEIRLIVNEKPNLIAVDDSVSVTSGESIDVVENDTSNNVVTIYEEDFEEDRLAWTPNPHGTDTATSGQWEVTDPVGTAWNGATLQTDDAASGHNALVTGANTTSEINDVDGGITSAISEKISVPADTDAELSFEYNFAHADNSSSDDFFRVIVIGESEKALVVEEFGDSTSRDGEWIKVTKSLEDFAGQNIQLLIQAGDLSNQSIVEAGIDNIRVEAARTPVVDEFTQGENGTISLNSDGTLSYVANKGFTGQDSFTYSLTDGEETSNFATVNVNVEADESSQTDDGEFVATDDFGFTFTNEQQYAWGFGLQEYSGVQVDQWAVQIENANYDLDPTQLTNQSAFTLTTTKNADGTFNHLFVGTEPIPAYGGIPGGNIEWSRVNFGQAATSDGFVAGTITQSERFADVGIQTGTSGALDLSFLNLTRKVSSVTLSGLPDFVKLSAGDYDGQNWTLESADLADLQIKAALVQDTRGWTNYQESYVYKNWDIDFSTLNKKGLDLDTGMFKFTTWQKV